MTLEIRPYREEEAKAFYRVPAIVFGNYAGPPVPDAPPVDNDFRIAPEWTLCAFEDGELATTYGAYPFVMRLNGAKAPAAGVTVVGTLPWYRRRGHLRKIMETDFKRRYEQRMEPIAVLLASIAAIYQRYGYAVCSSRYTYSIEPRMVNFAPSVPKPTGTWREGSKDELPLLQSMYRDFARERNGYLHRAPVIWDSQVLGARNDVGAGDAGPSLINIYEENGTPQGYVTYAAKFYGHPVNPNDTSGPGQRVFMRDHVWLTPTAYRATWELLKTFDLGVRILGQAPVDDPAFDVMLDPRELHATRGDWLLGRVLDIERALPLRPYGDGRAVFEVRDEMCPWNDGRWALEAGAGGATIARTTETPQLTLDVSTLAQLLFGQMSPSRAVRCGRAEAAPDAPVAMLDDMWRTAYAPHCPDQF